MPADVPGLQDVAERVRPQMAALTHCYGAIVVVNEGGQVASKGSMVLVRKASEHLVFTAKHVADEVPCYFVVRPPITPEESLRGHFSEGVMVPVSKEDIAWMPSGIDVAAFRAPRSLIELAHLRWFDAEDCSRAAGWVRSKWSADRPLPTVIMGCPHFGHVREPGLETLSLVPMRTKISAYDRVPWDGFSSRAPQIHLEVDDVAWGPPNEAQGLLRDIRDALRTESAQERLGGYSGGPLVVIRADGEFLIGVVTEGGYVFGVPRASAIAWDDIMLAFERRFSGPVGDQR